MIRYPKPTDREAFIQMADEFYHMPAVHNAIPRAQMEQTFDLLMEGTPYADCMIAEIDGKSAGYALLALTYSNEAGGLVVWLEELYIREQYRSHGIGREFFAFINRAYQGRVKRYRLEITPDNTRAESLYRALGYERLDYVQMVMDIK